MQESTHNVLVGDHGVATLENARRAEADLAKQSARE
jgi:hypothetical protein